MEYVNLKFHSHIRCINVHPLSGVTLFQGAPPPMSIKLLHCIEGEQLIGGFCSFNLVQEALLAVLRKSCNKQ